jgi:hypothetical protein
MSSTQVTADSFLSQIQAFAPSVYQLLTTYPARLKVSLASGDVMNSYGVSFTIVLTVKVLIEQCPSCAETQFDAPTFDCRWHRFQKRWMKISDAEGRTTESALKNLDRVIGLWMTGRERRAA